MFLNGFYYDQGTTPKCGEIGKIQWVNYKRWSMKIYYQLTIAKVAYVLTTPCLQDTIPKEEVSTNKKNGLRMIMCADAWS